MPVSNDVDPFAYRLTDEVHRDEQIAALGKTPIRHTTFEAIKYVSFLKLSSLLSPS